MAQNNAPNPDAAQGSAPEEQAQPYKKKPREVKSSSMTLNLTSMIDVIFQLLIYFMLTMAAAVGEGVLTAKLPQGSGAGEKTELPEKPLNIIIQSAGMTGVSYRISIEGYGESPSNFSDLAKLLARLQYNSTNPSGAYKDDNPIVIKARSDVRWQHVVNAFNAGITAKFKNIAFARPSEEGGE